MENVIATSSNEFRKNFKKYTDDVVDYQDAVIVTRPKNRNVVVISEDEYNSLKETAYLLKDKENREFSCKSILNKVFGELNESANSLSATFL